MGASNGTMAKYPTVPSSEWIGLYTVAESDNEQRGAMDIYNCMQLYGWITQV